MDDGKWARCSLRIGSRTRTAESISTALGATPTFQSNRGDPVSRHSPQAGLRKEAIWHRESGLANTEPLERHLEETLGFIEAHAASIRSLAGDCWVDLFCGYSSGNGQGSLELSHATLRRLAEAGIDLILDLYPAGADED